jgi:hypothetical protein
MKIEQLTIEGDLMNYRKLYIIGNGFDLWHGLPTKFSDFKSFVKESKEADLLEAIENYLPVKNDWSDLESALASLDIENILNDLEYLMPSYSDEEWSDAGHHSFQQGIGELVETVSSELRRVFTNWVGQVKTPPPESALRRLASIDANAIFLNFNYTSTVQKLYNVPYQNVLHIHGNIAQPEDGLILGHAWNPETRTSLNDRPDIEDLDTRQAEAHDILDDYFLKTFKPSQRIIEENSEFFEELNNIEEVVVLGHSLADVDKPYFEALMKIPAISSAKWTVACRNVDSDEEMRQRLEIFGAKEFNVKTVRWEII